MKYAFGVIVVFLLFQTNQAYSCLNSYEEDHTKLNGSYNLITNEEDGSKSYYLSYGFDINELQSEKVHLVKSLAKRRDYKVLSDYASVLLKLGEYKNGLAILEELIKGYPNEYNIVVNLGTAYELNNKPELALMYIKKAVLINPKSHHSSEWIHVKILEAVIALNKNQNYLKEYSILNLQIPDDIEGYYKNLKDGDINKLNEIKEALAWQLEERTAFVAPPNAVVSDLLYDLANLIALTHSVETSIPVYTKSIEYLPADIHKVLRRRDVMKEKLYWTNLKKHSLYCIAMMALIGFVYLIIRRRRNRRPMNTQATPLHFTKQKLWCEIHPLFYWLSIWEKRIRRSIKWYSNGKDYCCKISKENLPFRVKKHQSILIRKMGNSEIKWQYNKVKNLEIAIKEIDGIVIRPGETFSFCKLVGLPARSKGYKEGMELSRGEARPGVGGGICQIANLIHWLVMHSPLTITERHHHSFDPFPDNGRVLPFGSGATVFYNYIDYQFTNRTHHTFQINLRITEKLLEGELRIDEELPYAYSVYEVGHEFLKVGNKYYRKNEIWRRKIDKYKSGKELDVELITKNFAEVKYIPPIFKQSENER